MSTEWEPGSSLQEEPPRGWEVQFTAPRPPEEHTTYVTFAPVEISSKLGFCGRNACGLPVPLPGMTPHIATSGEEHSPEVQKLLRQHGLAHWHLCD